MLKYSLSDDNATLILTVSTNDYKKEVLHKCFYWYLDDYEISFAEFSDSVTEVHLKSKTHELTEENVSELKEKLNRDLLDFSLRQIVTEETQNIKDLLIAKAFEKLE